MQHSKQMQLKNMETMPNGPLEDIKKLGEILMRRTSEKEYIRFLQINEECRLKWQATTDKLTKLMRMQEKFTLESAEMKKSLQHINRLWEMEKQKRIIAEHERDTYQMKLKQTYEILRYDRKQCAGRLTERPKKDFNADKNNDEITSTGSFLSNLSDVSFTQTENDIFETSKLSKLSKEFNAIFGTAPDNTETQNTDGTLTDASQQVKNAMFEKTFEIETQPKRHAQIMDDNFNFKNTGNRHKMQSPSRRRPMKCPSVETINSTYLERKEKRELQHQSSSEVDPNPIYERIDDDSMILEYDTRANVQHLGRSVESASDILLYKIDANPKQTVSPHSCQHTFSHRSASRSVFCFLCSKKFRFGILAYKCSSCNVFVHHDCKTQLKIAAKTRRAMNYDKSCISDYVSSIGPCVPGLIVHCVNEVETRGLTERGIYRVSGSEKEVKALKDRFLLSNDVPDLSNVDMHVICGCIKIFLRGLREPLIPTWQWHVFSNAVVEFDGDSIDGNILKKLQFAISRLPKANRDTLAFLVLHLQRVATCQEVQMPILNLAKIFGPTVVGYSKQEPDHATILGETIIQQNVMQHFLNIPTDYWFSFICEDLNSV